MTREALNFSGLGTFDLTCEIPKSIWRNADWGARQKVLSHRVAEMAVNLDNSHQDLSNAIMIAQATSNQMSKCEPLRPYMDVIDDMLLQMFREDPGFKPCGSRLGENDIDYDADEKSMATLRRQLRELGRNTSGIEGNIIQVLDLSAHPQALLENSWTQWLLVTFLLFISCGFDVLSHAVPTMMVEVEVLSLL